MLTYVQKMRGSVVFPAAVVCLVNIVAGTMEQGVCDQGLLQCISSTQCIPRNFICDKELHCSDGSDEIYCDDKDLDALYDLMFSKRPGAIKDDEDQTCQLSYNSSSCLCRSTELHCVNRNYTRIPSDISHTTNITLLDLSSNQFPAMTRDLFDTISSLKVNTLNFAHCNIGRIEMEAFYNLNEIRVLHLDNNRLSNISGNLFRPGNKLEKLSLMYNRIVSLEVAAFDQLTLLKILDLRGNVLVEMWNETLAPLENLTTLQLQQNRIEEITRSSFPQLDRLITLSLMQNRINRIEDGSFATIPNLRFLYLSENRLVILSTATFHGLNQLVFVTLHHNRLVAIETDALAPLARLTSMTLEKNRLTSLDKRVFAPLTALKHVYFDRFELCDSALHVRDCFPKGDGISSHQHLLDNLLLRTSVWIMGAVGCTGNLVVLLGRVLMGPTKNVVHSLYLRNLAMSDLLMGVYLFAIAVADHRYRGVYIMHQYTWRHSYMCNLCGFLSTLSCESSVLILSLVTWDRFVSVTQPLARKQLSPKTAIFTLVLLWTLSVIIAVIPLSRAAYFGGEFYGNNGVCLPLHIHDPYAAGWEYSAIMFIMVNSLALLFICYAYLHMLRAIRASGVACRSTRHAQERDRVAQRFGVIVLTDCLCWVPVVAVKLVALLGQPIPASLYAWLAICVMPINCALNPVLYTLTTSMFRKQMKRTCDAACLGRRKRKDRGGGLHVKPESGSESGFSLSVAGFTNRRLLSYRGTQSSVTTSWKRQHAPPTTAAV